MTCVAKERQQKKLHRQHRKDRTFGPTAKVGGMRRPRYQPAARW
jgi:hypothetical protein